ncbi:MAG: alpha/beta hydrolase [Cyclobacteriaceae bacterium]|nr:alpha/beta hydrolase [Cyclobacteriaceae bacterium]
MGFIEYKKSNLHFSKAGKGGKHLLLFHGFGQDHRVFKNWVDALQDEYTCYSFDLYFHGSSIWQSREALEKEDWQKILQQFLQQEGISQFSVAGFSMGGKFAIATYQLFHQQITDLILLAPDGIKTSFWYSLATYPIAIRALFKSMILHPNRLHSFTIVLRKLRLVDAGLLRFAESQMNSEEKRRRVYYSWVYFRHLKFNQNHIAALVNQNKVNFCLITGKYDKVVSTQNMASFLQKVKFVRADEINSGHQELIIRVDPKVYLSR